jgi:hypothetical protein
LAPTRRLFEQWHTALPDGFGFPQHNDLVDVGGAGWQFQDFKGRPSVDQDQDTIVLEYCGLGMKGGCH